MNEKIKLLEEAIESCTDRYGDNRNEIAKALFLLNEIKEAINYSRSCIQLLCVEKGDDNGITRGYEYKCINQDKDHYKIIDNYGYENWFLKEYFTKIE